MQANNLHVLIDNNTRLEFFNRVFLTEKTMPTIVYHSNLYTWLKAKFNNHPGQQTLLKRKNNNRLSIRSSIEEVKQNKCINYGIDKQNINSKDSTLWVFSGFQFSALELIPNYKSVRYFEIANFPNKYQSSVKGVNADADYNESIKTLRKTQKVSSKDIEQLKSLLLGFRPPHVDTSIIGKAIEQIINLIGFHLFKTLAPHQSPLKQLSKAKEIHQVRKIIARYQQEELPKKFNLFIGQVTEDSQTLFQSNTDTIESIDKAFRVSCSEKIPLVVRLHPGEKNLYYLNKQIKYCGKNGIKISNNGNLLETVDKCEKVFTINSTGGLQSILFEKTVITYGKCFYYDWNKSDVVIYYKNILKNLYNYEDA